MNILTLIGAAAVDPKFCELLFEDPAKAAQLLGFFLTNAEVMLLRKVFNSEKRDEGCDHFGKLQTFICHHPPCPFVPVVPCKDDTSMSSAAD
jgi:hypothetical protein